MKKKSIFCLGLCMLLLLTAGCAKSENGEEKQFTATEEMTEEVLEQTESTLEKKTKEEAVAEGTGGEYSWREISLTFPESWEGRFYVVSGKEYMAVYQKDSYDRMEGAGFLFSISVESRPYYDYPSGGIFAYTQENAYVIQYPTDVPYYYDIEENAKDYAELAADVDDIYRSVKIQAENVEYHANEYILPMSEYHLLSENDLLNLSETQLWFARNEIFARHGYHFENEFLQACFMRCSWYADRGDDYREEDLTEIDLANLETIKAAEERIETVFSMELKEGEAYEVDLDHDNTDESIRYDAWDEETKEAGVLTINGERYVLGDFGIVCFEPEDHFYITDISPYTLGYEIAIADDGPSADYATFFFRYDGELHYLGRVEGFPMEQLNYFNGFEVNVVIGRIRTDLLGTTYGYARWWYNQNADQLEFQETGLYAQEPWYSHELLVDLPVYHSNSTAASVSVMKAGEKVFQMYTDGKEWVQLRNEEGMEGWVHITDYTVENVNMDIEQVFTDVNFFD